MTKYDFYVQALEKKLHQKNFQQLKSVLPYPENQDPNTQKILNFISFDFLNIAEHDYVKKSAIKTVLRWGSGSASSQVISHQLECQHQLEDQLAKQLGKECCLFLNPAQPIHSALLGTFLQKSTLVFIDESCHFSLFKAVPNKCKVIRFSHNNPDHLESLLTDYQSIHEPKWVILESLYSQEGDLVKLKEFLDLCQKWHCLTYLDETNTFSVLGHHGLGIGSLKKEIDCTVGFLHRGSGYHAAFIATKEVLKNYLIQFNPELSLNQILPPATLGAIDAYLQLIPDMHSERQKVMHYSRYLRQELQELGFHLKKSSYHLILIELEEEVNFQSFVDHLIDENILVFIQKPERLIRLYITAAHQKDLLVDFLKRVKIWVRPLSFTQV